MSGIFGVVSKNDCSLDLFYGVDYHSHLGTRRGGLAFFEDSGIISRSIHNIQNSPFRTKFERDIEEMHGKMGIGCISDYEPQPLLVNSRLGNFAITTVGRVANKDELVKEVLEDGYVKYAFDLSSYTSTMKYFRLWTGQQLIIPDYEAIMIRDIFFE